MAKIIGPIHAASRSAITYNLIPPHYLLYNWTADGGNVISGQGTPTVAVVWMVSGQCTLHASYGNTQAAMQEVIINVDVDTQGG